MPDVRNVVALVFNLSLNGLLADPDTDFWRFAFEALDDNGGPDDDDETMAVLGGASAHLMGRVAYEGMAEGLGRKPDHPWYPALTDVPKVVFSSTLTDAEWSGTTVVAEDPADHVRRMRAEGEGHLLVWGGVRLWRTLIAADLVDEYRVSLYPFLTDRGTSLFHDLPQSYRLDLASPPRNGAGVLDLHYRRHR